MSRGKQSTGRRELQSREPVNKVKKLPVERGHNFLTPDVNQQLPAYSLPTSPNITVG
jgi:hypothetical protein